jgi:hypothetical protein
MKTNNKLCRDYKDFKSLCDPKTDLNIHKKECSEMVYYALRNFAKYLMASELTQEQINVFKQILFSYNVLPQIRNLKKEK